MMRKTFFLLAIVFCLTGFSFPDSTPGGCYLGLIAVTLGLFLGGGAIKLISMAFPKFSSIGSRNNLKDLGLFLFTNLEMQKRLLTTIGILVVIQLASNIYILGINKEVFHEFVLRVTQNSGGKSSYVMQELSVMSLGLAPFFTACFFLQVFSSLFSPLKAMYFNRVNGRKTLTRHTYILTIVFVMIQAYFLALWMESPSVWGGMSMVDSPGVTFRILTVVTITAGVALLLFMGSLINRYGIGNGVAVIAVFYLLPRVPAAFKSTFNLLQLEKIPPMTVVVLTALFVTLVYLAYCLTKYFSTVEIQNNNGGRVQIPLRPTIVGKQPLIIAEAVFLFPATVLSVVHVPMLEPLVHVTRSNIFVYYFIITFLTVFLVYIYAIIVFDLKHIETLVSTFGYAFTNKEQGAEGLDKMMSKVLVWTGVALVSTVFLTKVCMLIFKVPHLTANLFSAGFLLVIVGVFADIISQVRFFKDKSASAIKQWDVCHIAPDEIEASIKSSFLKDNGIPALVEPLRFSWGLPARTMVDQYKIYAPCEMKETAISLLERPEQ